MNKELERLIELNGFELVRVNNHRVYQDKDGRNFVTAKTPSDYRAELNIKKELKRVVEKLGRKYIEEEPEKEKSVSQFNAPKIIAQPVEQMTMPKIKNPDAEFLRIALEGKAAGWTQRRISDGLQALGYRTPGGADIEQAFLSRYLIDHGHRTNAPYEQPTKRSAKAKKQKSNFMEDLMEILSSNMNDATKERYVIMLVENRDKTGSQT